MTKIQAFILGLLQGITELLPISSSAHLVLLPEISGWELQSTSFDIILHTGTLLALIIYFRKDLSTIVTQFNNPTKNKLLINLIITTIPASIIGIVFKDLIDEHFKSITIIVVMLITIGAVLLFIAPLSQNNKKIIAKLTYRNALLIGILQVLSFLRGTSRSGITIIGGITSGLDLKNSIKYAFLAGIPIIAASSLYQLFDFISNGLGNIDLLNLFIGLITSFISSFLAIKFIFTFFKNNRFILFGIYRIILGILIIFLLL